MLHSQEQLARQLPAETDQGSSNEHLTPKARQCSTRKGKRDRGMQRRANRCGAPVYMARQRQRCSLPCPDRHTLKPAPTRETCQAAARLQEQAGRLTERQALQPVQIGDALSPCQVTAQTVGSSRPKRERGCEDRCSGDCAGQRSRPAPPPELGQSGDCAPGRQRCIRRPGLGRLN